MELLSLTGSITKYVAYMENKGHIKMIETYMWQQVHEVYLIAIFEVSYKLGKLD